MTIIRVLTVATLLTLSLPLFARDVHVKGYYRSNGTYVKPHVRSAPDSHKWNNYGSGKGEVHARDQDKDGIYNQYDTDDDNDGVHDDDE